MLQQDSVNVLKALLLSNDSIQRRIDKMSSDVESQLAEKLKTSKFLIQLDKSRVSDNIAIFMAYVCIIDDSCKLCEEIMFAKLLETDIAGLSIFEATISRFDENQIPLGNLTSCTMDGAPSMLGKQNGFIAHMKDYVLQSLQLIVWYIDII